MCIQSPRIAIVTRMLTVKGGAELAILELAKKFNCDIYTTNYDPTSTYKGFSNLNICPSPLWGKGDIPLFLKFIKFPFIKSLRTYDLVVTSSGFYPKLVGIYHGLPPIVHYEQSPTNFGNNLARLLSPLDLYATKRIKKLVSNSKYAKYKLRARYGVDVPVIYPPVNMEQFKNEPSEDFFLSVQSITPQKRVHIQIKAFRRLPGEKLLIATEFCDPKYFSKIKEICPKNVEFELNLERQEIIDLYAKCKATIQTSEDENFGLVPIESMAAGKPCISVNEGGFRETVEHERTGILINEPYTENLVSAIKEFGKCDFNVNFLQERAGRFSSNKFIRNFKYIFNGILKNCHET